MRKMKVLWNCGHHTERGGEVGETGGCGARRGLCRFDRFYPINRLKLQIRVCLNNITTPFQRTIDTSSTFRIARGIKAIGTSVKFNLIALTISSEYEFL